MLRAIAMTLWTLGVASGCSPREAATAPEPAIPFELKRLDGTWIRTEDLRGSYVLLDFWATWCPPCVLEIPELRAVHEAYRDRGVHILAISVDDLEPDELDTWLRENGVTYPVALGTEELARQYGAFGFPFHVLVSPEGMIVDRLTPGFHDRDELSRLLDRHLRG